MNVFAKDRAPIPYLISRIVAVMIACAWALAVAGMIVCAWALAAAGCGYDPLNPSTQKTPTLPAVVGTWRLDKAGCAGVLSAANASKVPTIRLNEGGTFSAQDLPNWWNCVTRMLPGKKEYSRAWVLMSGSGRWTLMKEQGDWVVRLDFPKLPGSPHGLLAPVRLCGQEPPYRLAVIVGDPDEGQFLLFEREAAREKVAQGHRLSGSPRCFD